MSESYKGLYTLYPVIRWESRYIKTRVSCPDPKVVTQCCSKALRDDLNADGRLDARKRVVCDSAQRDAVFY